MFFATFVAGFWDVDHSQLDGEKRAHRYGSDHSHPRRTSRVIGARVSEKEQSYE